MASSTTYRLTTAGGAVVATDVAVAESMWSRFCGLMGRRELPDGHGLCIKPCSSIHMFFMRFPIDAVFVDGDGRVLKIYHSIKPWRATGFVRRAKACLELATGTALAHQLDVGDTVLLTAD
ncbi:MAG: DUF192 domain-containing protein [Candidatus Dormibacteraeota bacterium]|nr:DUF192 domain-containing protein [Candidatus Dormibacteraeota bacterium]